jgi:hypothetical protein
MGVTLPRDLREALQDPRTVKILSTVSLNGDAHLSVKRTLRLREDSDLEYDEICDQSLNSRNVLRAFFFNKVFLLNIHTWDQRAFKLAVKPKKAITTGDEFWEHFREVRESGIASDLGAVYIIEPLSFIEVTASRPPEKEAETEKGPVRREPIQFRPAPNRSPSPLSH